MFNKREEKIPDGNIDDVSHVSIVLPVLKNRIRRCIVKKYKFFPIYLSQADNLFPYRVK